MNTLEALWDLGRRPSISLYQIEVFSVIVTIGVYICMLVIAKGIITRGTSAGVPLKNFLTGAIMSSLALMFTEPEAAHGPSYIQNRCGTVIQCFVCLVILIYSANFNRDARLATAALVVFSVLMNMKHNALMVMIGWSFLHLVLIPGMDYLKSRNSTAAPPPDTLTLTLMIFGTLSLIGWSIYIYAIGVVSLAFTHFAGAVLSSIVLKDMLSAKVKTA